jgi:hypothetical protein
VWQKPLSSRQKGNRERGVRMGIGENIASKAILPVTYFLQLHPTSYSTPSYYESIKGLIH